MDAKKAAKDEYFQNLSPAYKSELAYVKVLKADIMAKRQAEADAKKDEDDEEEEAGPEYDVRPSYWLIRDLHTASYVHLLCVRTCATFGRSGARRVGC